MGYFSTLQDAVVSPLQVIQHNFAEAFPKIFYTTFVIVFGYLLAWFLGFIIKHALHHLKFDEKFKSLHIAKPLEKIHISAFIGWTIKWYTFIVMTAAGVNYIKLEPVTSIMTTFALWAPKLLLAITIGLFGAVAAEYVYKMVNHIHMSEAKFLAGITKYFILVIFITMALKQVIDVSILENVVLLVVGALALGLAVAIGIAFGLALRDEATIWIKEFKK